MNIINLVKKQLVLGNQLLFILKWMSKKTRKWLVRFLQTSIMIREER